MQKYLFIISVSNAPSETMLNLHIHCNSVKRSGFRQSDNEEYILINVFNIVFMRMG